MEAIYDRDGQIVGRLGGTFVYDVRGLTTRGRLLNWWVYTQGTSKRPGYVVAGYFVDEGGAPVACVAAAEGGPGLPENVPARRDGPLPGEHLPGMPDAPLVEWSTINWEQYLGE